MLKQFSTLVLFCMVMIATGAKAQNGNNEVVLKGRTINADNKTSLGFVNLGVVGTSLGTASDMDGEFTLTVPKNVYSEFELFVSAIGFESKKIKLNTLNADSIVDIVLEPTRYSLTEVDVNAKSRVLYGIVKDAVSKIKTNYFVSPYTYKFIFKSQREANGVIKSVEAKGQMYDSIGYQRSNFETAYASRTYTFSEPKDVEEKQFAFYKGMTIMDELLNFDIVKSTGNVLDVNNIDNYSLTLVGTTTFQDDSVYVIAYKNLQPDITSTGDYYATKYEGELYISKTSRAIVKNVTHALASQVSAYGRSFVVPEGYQPIGNDVEYDFSTTYQPSHDKYVLSTISLNTSRKNNGIKYIYHAELIVEDFRPAATKTVPVRDLLKAAR